MRLEEGEEEGAGTVTLTSTESILYLREKKTSKFSFQFFFVLWITFLSC